jgi:hypothetical protein
MHRSTPHRGAAPRPPPLSSDPSMAASRYFATTCPPYMRRRGRTCRPGFLTRQWPPPPAPEVAFLPPVDPRGQAVGRPRPHPPDRGRRLGRLPQGRGHAAAVHPPLAPRHP